MLFHPQNIREGEGAFVFGGTVTAVAHPCMNKDVLREFWHNFSFACSELAVTEDEGLFFSVGGVLPLPTEGYAYTVRVEQNGFCIAAESERDLLFGFMTLIDRIRPSAREDAATAEIACCEIADSPAVHNRAVHFCIFPETELWELRRFVRLCGALKFTHIVLEFWGMLRYHCMEELAWPCAFRKEEIRPIIREANDLGLSVIPMFNHWGHASAGRVMHGKHVVLDQNPSRQTYFSEDGWCWDIRRPWVRSLLREIRAELIELCGEGDYFHIGCDEAYGFAYTKENMDEICDFLNEVARELHTLGRRPIVWGDMFLYRHPHYNAKNDYCCASPSAEAEEYMLGRLDRRTVIADWQYDTRTAPVETALRLKQAGFSCFLCPWDRGEAPLRAALQTVKEHGLCGYIHTTWHTLSAGMPYVTQAALGGWGEPEGNLRTKTAALLRKVMPARGDYKKAGWSRLQIGFSW